MLYHALIPAGYAGLRGGRSLNPMGIAQSSAFGQRNKVASQLTLKTTKNAFRPHTIREGRSSVKRKVHFVGVGGIGMSGLAEILLNLGYDVSGSDLQLTDITRRLESLGLHCSIGHDASNVSDAEILVVSAAVSDTNAEVLEAQRLGIPVVHRSEMLADIIRLKPNAVVVAGTHGKTTTTSMMSAIFDRANIGATSIIGGILHRSGTNARWGTGDYIVAEADEHDGSFLRLHPTIGVVTNIDEEHLEYYGSLDRIKKAFTDFANAIPFYGYSIVCWDDPSARSILSEIESLCLTYGLENGCSLQGTNIRLEEQEHTRSPATRLASTRTCFDVLSHDERLGANGPLGTVTIQAIGRDNVRNALATVAVGLCLGMPFGLIAEGLRDFDGVRRRMHVCGERRGVVVIEDYAHHPTEIRSTLEALSWAKPNRVICIFQPHLYSRTKFLSDDFAQVLTTVDRAIVTDIYASREDPMPGVDSGIIVDAAREIGGGNVEWVRDMHQLSGQLVPDLKEGDFVLLLGAGDINSIGPTILNALEERA